jgi:hypothetical protein
MSRMFPLSWAPPRVRRRVHTPFYSAQTAMEAPVAVYSEGLPLPTDSPARRLLAAAASESEGFAR